MTIHSISAPKGEIVTICHTMTNPNGSVSSITAKSDDAPLPELYAALAGLRRIVCNVLDLSEGDADSITVTGVEFDARKGKRIAFVKWLTGQEEAWKAKTPWTRPVDDADRMLFDVVVEQADHYISGKRAQTTLALATAGTSS